VATAYLARSLQIVSDAAAVLGHDDDAEKYAQLAREVRAAFAAEFVTSAGLIHSDAATVYALSIEWDLLPTERQRRKAGSRLADLVRSSGFRITTGFVGTPVICAALTSTGHVDVAYRLLLQTQCPSWLYPITMGATTIWERWDSMRPDGSINPSGMTSFNHYALGAVADWMHRTVAGLGPASPGYRSIEVRPLPGSLPALTSASARHLTPYGEAAVTWKRAEGVFHLRVQIPVGSTASVYVPGAAEPIGVGHGLHEWEVSDPVSRMAPVDWSSATVRDLIDDAVTWQAVVDEAVAVGVVSGDAQAARMVQAYFDAPASDVAQAFVDDERFPGGREIRSRVSAVLRISD
jgi:alpha-L-rhamnosidase